MTSTDTATTAAHPPLLFRQPQLRLLAPEQGADLGLVDDAEEATAPVPGRYEQVPSPAVLVYRVESGTHRQTGIVLEVAVEDYRAGRIRRHEATRAERVRQLCESRSTAGVEQVPVTLAHTGGDGLPALLAEVTEQAPELRVTTQDGTRHEVWVMHDSAAIHEQLAAIDALYIADGHHRMAAAAADTDEFTLAVLFPAEELRILSYHRCVAWPAGFSTEELLTALAATPVVIGIEEHENVPDASAGRVPVWLDGRWYLLQLAAPSAGNTRSGLDVVAIDEGVLGPVFGIEDIQEQPAVTPLAGGGTAEDVARWCTEHEAIGFLPHPPTVSSVFAVADEGMVLPPKSTWFDPKIRSALFLRELHEA